MKTSKPLERQNRRQGRVVSGGSRERSTIHAIQINYADQDAEFLGKQTGTYHQYKILISDDGKSWKTLVDKSNNKTDVPHDYIEPLPTRYRKIPENGKHPYANLLTCPERLQGIRKGSGNQPTG